MNGIAIILISAVVLIIGYLGYGRWLAKSWGVDSKALTPAVRMEDGKDFSPASRFTVFAHQFSSICGAGPVQGTIVAMAFGWVPVMLWVLVGGIFFGAVHDFGALYASMKNNGKSLAQLIEKYIGKTGRRLFLIFSWLFCLIVIAAFTSMVASTFKVVAADGGGVDLARSYYGAAAGTISLLFTFVAIAFGWFCRRFDLKGWKQFVCALVLIVAMFAVGMQFPIYLDTNGWIAVTMAYLVFAAAMPIQKLKQPRDYLTTIMMVVMIVAAVLGIFAMGVNGQAEMTAPAFVGFTNASGQLLFPVLFVSVACGALSGFHSLVSSGTSSKQVANETDALSVGYGAMVLESFVGMLAVVIAAIMYKDMNTGNATPFQIFAGGVAKGVELMGVNSTIATVFMTMCVSALALTSLDAVARIARVSLQEFFAKTNDARAVSTEKTGIMKIVGNPWFATVVTLLGGLSLTFGGYLSIWPLFGASNQLLGGMTMITIAVFCKVTGRKGWMLYVPVAFLLCCIFTSLVQSLIGCVVAISAYGLLGTTATGASVLVTSGIQLVFAVLLVVLGVIVAYNCLKELFTKKAGSVPDEEPEWSGLGRRHVEESKHDVAVDAKTEVTA
ncbi:carbon starvation protein A [Olsenella sp. Marseille-P4559]|uniref:carbon starvation CstA family protein n=1 Tax=Olsenella sp. Marseille-P4559 TaxID=2364795 RepID=UPI00102FD765|nr:carbon starvation CstA family protein [Olsenella sp. Marseille-P4559]